MTTTITYARLRRTEIIVAAGVKLPKNGCSQYYGHLKGLLKYQKNYILVHATQKI